MEEPDPRTIRAAVDGDGDALTELIRHAQPHVWRFVRHLVGDDELASDLTQETFVRVHRSIGSFRHDARFRTWVFHIARNVAIDELRRSSRRARLEVVQQGDARAEGRRPGPDLAAELKAALMDLPAVQREAFVLVEVFGLRYREVAEILDTAEGTVKTRVYRARLSLVDWFRAGEVGEGGRG